MIFVASSNSLVASTHSCFFWCAQPAFMCLRYCATCSFVAFFTAAATPLPTPVPASLATTVAAALPLPAVLSVLCVDDFEPHAHSNATTTIRFIARAYTRQRWRWMY